MTDDEDECANPLLLGFLKDWYDTARQQNARGVATYLHIPYTFSQPNFNGLIATEMPTKP